MHYPEDDPTLPLLVRNLFAEENRNPDAWPHGNGRNHIELSKMIAQGFSERWDNREPFMGYVVPYGSTLKTKVHKFNARWTFEAAQDAKAAAGIDIMAELTSALSDELIAECCVLADRDQVMIFPYIVRCGGILIDPNTFEPVATFQMEYQSGTLDFTSPIDFTKSPPIR